MAKSKKTIKKGKASQLPKKAVKKSVKKISKQVTKKVVKKLTAPKAKKTLKKAVKKVTQKAPQKVSLKINPPKNLTPKVNIDYSKAVTPLGDRLVVRVVHGEKMTAGGLYIPDMVNSAVGHLKGEVLAVGQGHTTKKGFLRSMDVKKGDHVLFAEHAGTVVVFNSEELSIVNETDVLGIIQK